ncbi:MULTISPECIES: GntR family transcriptional regulator [unclassified Streptomyces]|uniref:GntR family transcriptional regulator n=1 Tax=unclassified Streptomyces TaxID=2593676 RepID=UPI003325EBBF
MSSDARYRRIASDLRRRIAMGEWVAGQPLPSRVAMANQYGVHEQTMRLAYVELRRTGILEGEQRQAVFVAHPPAMRTLTNADAPWPWVSEVTHLGSRRASEDIAGRLGVAVGATLHYEVVEQLDPGGRSAMVVHSWWQGRRRPHATFTAEVGVAPLDERTAHALGLLVDTLSYRLARTRLDAGGLPVETADLYLPLDRWTIRLHG